MDQNNNMHRVHIWIHMQYL